MPERIQEPNIYLFAFQLEKSFDQDAKTEPLDLFLERCKNLLQKFRVEPLQDLNAQTRFVQEIAGEINLNTNQSSQENQQLKVTGFVERLPVHDSCTLGINIGFPSPEADETPRELDITQLHKLNPQNCFLPEFIQASLGQTLLITARLTTEQKQQNQEYIQNLAQKCLEHFIPGTNTTLPLNQATELFGSAIFEYGRPTKTETDPHIIVWLFKDSETELKFEKIYQYLVLLFLYRHKIVKSYLNSRDVKLVIKTEYQEREKEINNIFNLPIDDASLSELELGQLKAQLKSIFKTAMEYVQMLRDLEDYHHTIALNNQNYLDNLQRISNKFKNDTKANQLSFFQEFSQKNCQRFQEQIQADLGYFLHGKGLLDQAIASIRGIVEIDQAERDRQRQKEAQTERDRKTQAEKKLQQEIEAIGVGIAAGAFVASSSGLMTQPWELPNSPKSTGYPHPFLISLFLSSIIALIAWRLMKQIQHHSK